MTAEQLEISNNAPKYHDKKFERSFLNFAKKNLISIIEVESIIEIALKNLTKTFKIPCADKKAFIFLMENLTSIHIIYFRIL